MYGVNIAWLWGWEQQRISCTEIWFMYERRRRVWNGTIFRRGRLETSQRSSRSRTTLRRAQNQQQFCCHVYKCVVPYIRSVWATRTFPQSCVRRWDNLMWFARIEAALCFPVDANACVCSVALVNFLSVQRNARSVALWSHALKTTTL